MHTTVEPIESIDAEVFSPGNHAYLTLNGMTLAEAVKMCFIARIAKPGDNVSPPVTLRHAGEIVSVLVSNVDDTYVTLPRDATLTTLRVDGTEHTHASRTPVMKR